MIRNLRLLVACSVSFLISSAAISACAESPATLGIQNVRVGWNGQFQVGSWTPVSVSLTGTQAGEARLVTLAPDADGQLVRFEGPVVSCTPGQSQNLTARFISGRMSGEIVLRVEAGEQSVERRLKVGSELLNPESPVDSQNVLRAHRQDVPLWGLFGTAKTLLKTPDSGLHPSESTSTETNEKTAATKKETHHPLVLRLQVSDIPNDVADMRSLDFVVLAAGASVESAGKTQSIFSALSDQQNTALRDWVQVHGGHLVISIGEQGSAFASSKLGQWIQVKIDGTEEIRQVSGLESYSGFTGPLRIDRPLTMTKLSNVPSSQMLAQALGMPLIVQVPSGFGRVTVLTVDLDRPPVSNWEGTDFLIQRLHRGERSDNARDLRAAGTQLAKSGINDLSSQLYAAEEEFTGVTRLSLWAVMLLLLAYVLIVGPLDYLVVHRILKRPNLTWITFPVWVVGGAIGILFLAQTLNGQRLLTRQLDVLDLDTTSQVLRGRSWMTVYSPQTSRYDIVLDTHPVEAYRKPEAPLTSPHISWLALAENRVGGLYREGGVAWTQRQYSLLSDGSGVTEFPMPVWSTGRFGGEWSTEAGNLIESKLVSSGFGQLTGTIRLRLPEALEDCMLAYGNRVYFPVVTIDRKKTSHLPKFYTWEIGRGQPLEQRELRGFLNEIYTRAIKRENPKDQKEVGDFSKPYDPSRRDLPYILRMLTFHQSAGGEGYTGLRNDVLENMDLSQQIRMGRAVLTGRLAKSTTTWKVDGQAVTGQDPVTYVRIVLPVEREISASPRILLKPEEKSP